MRVAVDQEVVPERQDDVGIGFEHEPGEELRESRLDRRRVLGEQLLELIDEDERVLVPGAPSGDGRHGRVGVVESDERLERRGVVGAHWHERLCQRLERLRARRCEHRLPGRRQGRQQASAEKRALARARRSDHPQQPRPLQLLPDGFDLDLATEEVLRVLLGERREARIRLPLLHSGQPERHLFEGARQRVGGRVPAVAARCERPLEDGRPGTLGYLRRRLPHAAPQRLAGRQPVAPSHRHHLGQHHASREDVRARVDLLAARLFGGHVRRRTGNRHGVCVACGARHAEVHDDHATGTRDHHVLGLEVPVHEPGRVDRLEPGEELRGDVARLGERQGAARLQGFAERRAVDVLHRQQLLSALVYQIEDAAHVRREHLSGGTDLASQQVAGALVPRVAGTHRLQRHVHPQLQIEGAVHLAHAAAAEQLANLVPVTEKASGSGAVPRRRVGRVVPAGGFEERQAQQALGAEAFDRVRDAA